MDRLEYRPKKGVISYCATEKELMNIVCKCCIIINSDSKFIKATR
jgi:hypothetical protein